VRLQEKLIQMVTSKKRWKELQNQFAIEEAIHVMLMFRFLCEATNTISFRFLREATGARFSVNRPPPFCQGSSALRQQ